MKLEIEDTSSVGPLAKNASAISFGTVFRGVLGGSHGPYTPGDNRLYLCTGLGIVALANPGEGYGFDGGKLRVYDYSEPNAKLYVKDDV